jgi:hypothetical protein
MFRKIRRVVAFFLFVVSLFMILWAALPNHRLIDEGSISPAMMVPPADGKSSGPGSIPARIVRLEMPASMRIGDEELIKLRFSPATGQNLSDGLTEFTDAYTFYNIMAEGRYEVAGMHVDPANPTRESMPAGQPVEFTWKITTDEPAAYEGNIWLSLRYLPLDGSPAIEVPIYAREFTIHTSSLLGMNESQVYLLGGLGILISAVIVYDDIIGIASAIIKKKASRENSIPNVDRTDNVRQQGDGITFTEETSHDPE